MRRIITIILILLLAALVVLTGAWLLSRRAAVKEGQQALTFREFLTSTVSSTPDGQSPGSLGSVFVDPSVINSNLTPGSTTGDTDPTTGAPTTQVSQFTNNGLTPSISDPTAGGSTAISDPTTNEPVGAGLPSNQYSNGTTGTSTGGTASTVTGVSTLVANECSIEDKNIPFTQDELSRLRGLQNRFYVVATTLHTDADVAAEISNHDNITLKLAKLTTLNQYCATNQPKITDPVLKRAVPTPFWHESGRDILVGFFSNGSNYGGDFSMGDSIGGQRNLDQALRLNLW